MGRAGETPPSATVTGSGETVEESKNTSPTRSQRSDYSDAQDESHRGRRRRDRRHKSGKHRKPHQQSSRASEPSVDEQTVPRYCHLEEAAVHENDQGGLKAMERERRRRNRRDRRGEDREDRSSRRAIDATEPVYMPRSKYYPDPEEEPDSSSRSRSNHNRSRPSSGHHRHHRRRHHRHGHQKSMPIEEEADRSIYVGPKTPSQVIKCLKPNEFCIYYQLPDKRASIPYKLRLFLAYMSSQNKEVFHFPIVCGKNARTGEDVWSLRYTDSATFPTLQALIKYHKIYSYMDPNTGKIDTFPVWKGAIINDDSYNE